MALLPFFSTVNLTGATMELEVIVLAAGKGTRMYSDIPKVLHRIGGKSMLAHVVDAAAKLKATKTHLVTGYQGYTS